MADIGQEEDFEAATLKAKKIGASKVFVEVGPYVEGWGSRGV